MPHASRIAQIGACTLCLAAAPTFALLALWSGIHDGGATDVTCMGMAPSSPLGGMTLMYALMAAVHAAPWLRRIAPH